MSTLRVTIPALPCARRTRGRPDHSKPPRPKLVGYYTKGAVPNWTRASEYHDWKDHVREHIPDPLPAATAERPVRIDVWCWFENGIHHDPENVRKGVVDTLYPGGDKFVYGYHHHPLYDRANPRAEVIITWEDQ